MKRIVCTSMMVLAGAFLAPPRIVSGEELAPLCHVPGAKTHEIEKGLTLIEVPINPLGAPPDTPWTVHVTSANVRPTPALDSTPLGTLPTGSQVAGPFFIVQESDLEFVRFTYQNQEAWISTTTIYRPHPRNIAYIGLYTNLPYGSEIVNRWWALPSTYEANDLVTLPTSYTNGGTQQLRAEPAQACMDLIDAAAADGVQMYALSCYRSWSRQQTIYLGNVANNPAQRSSAPPGHSEHQLGATLDFGDPATRSFVRANTPQHDWLLANGASFGFRQTYTDDNTDETGYIVEPWHWRYFGDALDNVGDIWQIY